jgi:pimeloyl-ACP methyl ester carboxylesterase
MTTWVLLRGLTREAAHWGSFPQSFRRRVRADAVLCPDLPGCGGRHRERSPGRVEEIAESVRANLSAGRHRPPFHVLALSLGAMTAVAWAKVHPQEISGLVLINTSMRPFNPAFMRLRPRNLPALARLAIRPRDGPRSERLVFRMTSNRSVPPKGLIEDWAGISATRPVSRINAWRQLRAAALFRADSTPIVVPTLMLASAGDCLVDCRCSCVLAARWNARLVLHPWAGHDLPLDDPDWVGQKVVEWLRLRANDPRST